VSRVDLGVKIEHTIMFGLSPELNGYTPERTRVFFERLEERLAATPGVTGVTVSLVPLLGGSNWGSDVAVQGFPAGPDTDNNARYNEIGPGYFRTLGVPLIAGREFTPADGPQAPKVTIVNQEFVKKFNLGHDAVGKLIGSGRGRNSKLDTQIVGVVQNAKYSEVKQEVPPQYFMPYRQDSTVGAINFYVRTSLSPQQLMRTIRGVIAALDPNLPVEDLKTLPQQIKENVALDRMISTLSASFAVLATLLAAVGLYGVLAYTVTQRTREIGVRMALGADQRRVRGMVLKQVGVMTLIGGVIGLAAAFGLGRAAASLLFELKGHDPIVFATAAATLALVAFGAGYLPARRASRVEPMQALRYE
jgi:predicted permease